MNAGRENKDAQILKKQNSVENVSGSESTEI
jgi:hypothetical protein